MARRLVVVGCLLALLVRGDIDYAEISFYPPPPEKCAPTEITLTFEIAGGLQHLDTVYFYLNQFTRGGCNNGNGGKISDGLVLLGAPSGNDEWQAEYYEGSVDNMYNDSYIILKAKYDVIGTAGYRHTVVIDASNDIRPNCGSPANSSLMRVKGFVYKDAKAQYIRPVNKSDAVDLTCYMTDTRLKFRPAIPKESAQIEVRFRSAIHLYVGDRVRVQMAGWTSGKADGIPGSDDYYVAVRDDLAVIGNSTWLSGSWEEGCCYEAHRAGFLNSTLVLTALQYIRAGTTVEVIVPRQQLRPQCGMPGPYVNQTMSVRRAGQRVYEYVKKAYPETTLNGAVTDSATTVTLATGGHTALGVAQNSYILIGGEVMLVSGAVSSEALTVTRAQASTTASAHVDGAKVYLLTESTLDGAITSTTATSFGVDLNTGGLGAAANTYILIGSEVLKVTAVSTNALTVIRGQDGTTATTHLDAAKVFLLKSNVKIEKEPYAQQITETTINEGAAFSKSDTTLTVTSGTTLGAVANGYILIGSEILLVTAVSTNDLTVTRAQDGTTAAAHADGAKVFRITVTTVSDAGDGNANLAAADTTLSVTLNDPGLFAAVNSYIRIGSEVMLVTAVSTNDLTVSRAQDGTTAVDHTDGSMIYRLTESTLDGALTDSATTVNVDLNTAGLGAAANSYILIGSEVLLVTAVSTNALTVTRAQHGTNAAAHLDGAKVFLLKDTLDHTLEIDSTYVPGVEVVAPRSIDEANAIGDGCKSLGFCTGKGECDHCTSTCRCPHAHRAVDNSYTSYSCEAINCPTGMAWADVPWHPGGAGDNTWAHHRRLPCSGAGLCTAAGKCSCFANFFGPACERRVCPGGSAETGDCSGHGTCATMKQLSMLPNALPLSKNNVSGYHAGDHVPYYEHHAHGRDDGTWDAMRLYGCVCDSSWPVGLGPGETQEPEYFGPTCAAQHCPSGDDPMTARDETNCTGVLAKGGHGVGEPGNLCHVDCSNRGFCDHETGQCKCFQGFYGHNCHYKDALAVQIEI